MKRVKYDPTTETVTLGDGTTLTWEQWQESWCRTVVHQGNNEEKTEESEAERLKEFFFGKKVEPISDISRLWKDEGRCPLCGELGRIHLSSMICSTHGEYK